MPIFEYLCSGCNVKSEKIQSQPLEQITCPSCGKKATKVVSMTASAGSETGESCAAPAGSGFG